MSVLPTPELGRVSAERYVERHLADLVIDDVRGSVGVRGGQAAADAALAAFDVRGYAANRNEVLPIEGPLRVKLEHGPKPNLKMVRKRGSM